MTLNMKRIRAQLEKIAAEDETLDEEEEDEAQPEQEVIPQGESKWVMWFRVGLVVLVLLYLLWIWWRNQGLASEGQPA